MRARGLSAARRAGGGAAGIAAVAVCAVLAACSDRGAPAASAGAFDLAAFRDPPPDSRPWVRWWWPGGAVAPDVLRAEIAALRDVGYGGVEIQPLAIGLAPADETPAVRSVGSAEFFSALGAAIVTARDAGLGVDVTLGSGWPMGGPFVAAVGERQLVAAQVDVRGPVAFAGSLPRPTEPAWVVVSNAVVRAIGTFDESATLAAAVAGRIDASHEPAALLETIDLTPRVSGEALVWDVPPGDWRIFAFWENGTRHFVVGGAYPGAPEDALVVDHLSSDGAAEFLAGYAEPMLAALGDARPDGVFIDSFELLGELPWTAELGEELRRRAGPDAMALLPYLLRAGGETHYVASPDAAAPAYASPRGERAREDYEEARAALFHERFLAEIARWADTHGLVLRMQAHGGWGDVLEDYGVADVPESEGLYAGGSYDFLKLASSAAHVAGKQIASAESFVAFVLDPGEPSVEDLYLLAGRALSAGITRLVQHGHPYPLSRSGGSTWYPFELPGLPFVASTRLAPGTAAWAALPELNAYVARLQLALRFGRHRAQVARLFGRRRVEDRLVVHAPGFPPEEGESATSLALRRSGLVWDWVGRDALAGAAIDDRALVVGRAGYDALVVEDLESASADLLSRIEAAADAGVPVLVRGALPRRAPGLRDASEDAAVAALADRLAAKVRPWRDPGELRERLRQAGVRGAVRARDGDLPYAVDVRAGDGEQIVVLCNEHGSGGPVAIALEEPATSVFVLDPATGASSRAAVAGDGVAAGGLVDVDVPPRRCLVLLARA